MVVSTLHITLENNGNVAGGQPAVAAAVGAATSPTKFAQLSVQQLQLQHQQQNEKENHMNNNNNSDYCDMNGNGIASGVPGSGPLSPHSPEQYAGSPVSSTATPQRTASALRRGIQIQRSSTRLRQQQASLWDVCVTESDFGLLQLIDLNPDLFIYISDMPFGH